MLKRRLPTEEEKRLRRIRWAWGSVAAGLLAGLLLLSAWVSTQAVARNRAMVLVAERAPAAVLAIRAEAVREAMLARLEDQSPAALERAARAFAAVRGVTGPAGEVLFWEESGAGAAPAWLAWFPFRAPQRVHRLQVARLLEETGYFAPAAGGEREDVVGYYRVTREFVVVSSSPDAEAFSATPGAPVPPTGLARLVSPGGYVPPLLDDLTDEAVAGADGLLIDWPADSPLRNPLLPPEPAP